MHISFQISVSFSLDKYPGVELLDNTVVLVLMFEENICVCVCVCVHVESIFTLEIEILCMFAIT